MDHLGDELHELMVGVLEADARPRVEAHLARCEACSRARDELAFALATLAVALPPVAPPPALRARVLAALDTPQGVRAFLGSVASLFHLAIDQAAELLDAIVDPARWSPGPAAGIDLFHLEPGPALAGADAGLVRLQPGVRFPRHRHAGEERVVVLQGRNLDSDGTVSGPGTLQHRAPGSEHDFLALDGPPCIFAVVLYGGLHLTGSAVDTAPA